MQKRLGSVVLESEKVAMLHCRSKGMDEMCICVLRLEPEIRWKGKGKQVPVRTVLILLGPLEAPEEYFDLIGEISVSLADGDFVRLIVHGTPQAVKEEIRFVLKRGYVKKAGDILR